MPELSFKHIEQITYDIQRQDIVYSHLVHDLIDHVCCDVEYEMNNGLSFSEAYAMVKKKIGPRRLQEIQEETLYSVDTKYRYMKTTMKISGVAGTIVFATAALFKIQHWPGAGIMLTLGALILAFVFLPSALIVLWKETHSKNKLFLFISSFLTGFLLIMGTVFKVQHWPAAGIMLSFTALFGIFFFIPSLLVNRFYDNENKKKRPIYVVGAVGIICYTMGLLFKIQHWPLSSILMVMGVLILGVIILPLYTWITYKDETHIKGSFIFIIIGMIAIIIPGAMINLNLQNTYDEGYYPNLTNQQNMTHYLQDRSNTFINNLTKDSSANSLIIKLHSETISLLSLITDIEAKMVQASEIKPGKTALNTDQVIVTKYGKAIDVSKLSNAFQSQPVNYMLAPGTITRQNLDDALIKYKTLIGSLSSDKGIIKFSDILDPSILLPGKMKDGQTQTMITGLHSLELLKCTILTAEKELQSLLSSGN